MDTGTGQDDPAPADDVDALLVDKAALGRTGFSTGSDLYERARPGYSPGTVEAIVGSLGIGPGSRVLDMASGTGKLTRALVDAGATCVAAEPSASMRASFATVLPTVAQAFHWFDTPEALEEFARVLRPGGGLALVWNERDESDPLVAELTRISKWDKHQPYPVGRDFGAVVDASGRFGPVTRTRLTFVQPLDRIAFVEQVASRSYITVLPEDRRRAILDDVADLAAGLDEPILLPYLVDLFCAHVR